MREFLRRLLLAVLSVLSVSPGHQEPFTSRAAQVAIQGHEEKLQACDAAITRAAAAWVVSMQDAKEEAMSTGSGRGRAEAERIQAALDAVNDGWPKYDSPEHEALLAQWEFETEMAKKAASSYRREVLTALKASKRADTQRATAMQKALDSAMKGGGEDDLSEANRIHNWLVEMVPDSETLGAWELLSEQEALARRVWKPHRELPDSDHVNLSWSNSSGQPLGALWISGDGTEQLKWNLDEAHEVFSFPGHAFALRDSDNHLIAVLVVGEGDAEIQITSAGQDPPLSGIQMAARGFHISVVVAVPVPEPITPWPKGLPEVESVRASLEKRCLGRQEEFDKLRAELIAGLGAARDTVVQGEGKGRIAEALRIQRAITALEENPFLFPTDSGQWPFTSRDAQVCLEDFIRSIEEASRVPERVRLRFVANLEKVRKKVMKRNKTGALLMANRIQATIDEVRSSPQVCSNDALLPSGPGAFRVAEHVLKRKKDLRRQDKIHSGLKWLAHHQDRSGMWDCDEFMKHDPANDLCTGPGSAIYDIGVTGLALLAFIECGESEISQDHRVAVARARDWLLGEQDPETGLFGEEIGHTFLYDHGIATLALLKLLHTRDPHWPSTDLIGPCQLAVDYILRARNSSSAWRYDVPPEDENDTSVTGWMVACLESAESAGLKVDPVAFVGALGWIDHVTDPANGRVGYYSVGSTSSRITGLNDDWPVDRGEAMTAVALYCRTLLGQEPKNCPMMAKHVELMLKRLPRWSDAKTLKEMGWVAREFPAGSDLDMYYCYYGTKAMAAYGGSDWKKWKAAVLKIVDSTESSGSATGSWDPNGPWAVKGGRVYSTSLMLSSLALVYAE